MLRDRTRQRTAPPPVIPQGTMTEEAAWGALDRARATFRATVMSADGLALNTVTVAHPAFGTLSVYQWVELIAVHEGATYGADPGNWRAAGLETVAVARCHSTIHGRRAILIPRPFSPADSDLVGGCE
jgi:hypothetical protein